MNRENVVNSKKEFTGIPRKSKKFHKNPKKLRKIACALGTPPNSENLKMSLKIILFGFLVHCLFYFLCRVLRCNFGFFAIFIFRSFS